MLRPLEEPRIRIGQKLLSTQLPSVKAKVDSAKHALLLAGRQCASETTHVWETRIPSAKAAMSLSDRLAQLRSSNSWLWASSWTRKAIWGGLLLGAIFGTIPVVTFLAAPGISWSNVTYEDFHGGLLSQPGAITSVEGFQADDAGWRLSAGASGRLVYRMRKSPGSHLAVQIWMHAGLPGVTSGAIRALWESGDAQLAVDPQMTGGVLELPNETDSADRIDLEFSAHNTGKSDALIVDQLVWGEMAGQKPAPTPQQRNCLALGAVLALAILPFRRVSLRRCLVLVTVGIIVALAVYLRLEQLAASSLTPLEPDASGYRAFGDAFEWWPLWAKGLFSGSSGMREPFFPLVVRAYFDVLGSSDFHLRVVSSTLSMLAVPLSIVAARRRASIVPSLGVGAVVALNSNLIAESARGLRTELELVLLLLVYIVLESHSSRTGTRSAGGAGLTAAALVLTRIFYLPVVLMAGLIALVPRGPRRRAGALALGVFVVLVGGAAVGQGVAQQVRNGDAFYESTRQARWYANAEWYRYHRELSHPEYFPMSAEEVAKDGFAGPRISTWQYLFELHSAIDVARDSLLGFVDFYRALGGFAFPLVSAPQPLNRAVDHAVNALSVFGLVALLIQSLRNTRNLLLPVMVVGTLGFSTFLLHRELMEPQRNTIVVYPLMLAAGAWLADRFGERAGAVLRGQAAPLSFRRPAR